MSVKMKTVNSNFQKSLRSSRAKLTENQDGPEGINGKNSIFIKKQPIEFAEKYIFAINPNNPNYKKSDMLHHNTHNGTNPQKEISHIKRTYSCSNISKINHMVGQEERKIKPLIRLKNKIIENNKESLIKVKRKKDYSVLFFEKENFENKLNKQGSVKDLNSNPFSEDREITKYGIEIGRYQQQNRSNSASNLRAKSTRDYFYNSNQFIDCLPNKNKKTQNEISNKITFENLNSIRLKKNESIKEISKPANDVHVKDLLKPIPRLLNQEINSTHKSNIKVNNSTSIYKIFNNKVDSKINLKKIVNDKIYNTHFNLFDTTNVDSSKKYNHKSFQVFKDNKVCFY